MIDGREEEGRRGRRELRSGTIEKVNEGKTFQGVTHGWKMRKEG